MFISCLFDMTTTAINNYMDFKNAKERVMVMKNTSIVRTTKRVNRCDRDRCFIAIAFVDSCFLNTNAIVLIIRVIPLW